MGDGKFQAGQAYVAGPWPRSIVIDDFKGNFIQDLAVSNALRFPEGSITVLPGIGGDQFGAPVTTGDFSEPVAMAAADVNGDGILDVLSTAGHYPLGFDV